MSFPKVRTRTAKEHEFYQEIAVSHGYKPDNSPFDSYYTYSIVNSDGDVTQCCVATSPISFTEFVKSHGSKIIGDLLEVLND